MKTVFADSFYFFALSNGRDPRHQRAVDFLRDYNGRLAITEWILTELGDGLCHPANRNSFLITLDKLRTNPNVVIFRFSEELFEAGIARFKARPDKEWSLTDCISFVVMEREGIVDALTADRHFEQAGFVALLK
jgi:hypothetical protein